MKDCLSIEQSAELIKRGVSKDKASEKERVYKPIVAQNGVAHNIYVSDAPIFTLADLLSLLPKKLYGEETDYCDCELHIHAGKLGWSASYMEIRGSEVVVMKLTSYGVELIDTLFSLLCKLLDTHVKLD